MWGWLALGGIGTYLILRKKSAPSGVTASSGAMTAPPAAPVTPAAYPSPPLPNVGTSSYSAACWTKDVQNASDLVTAWHAAVAAGKDTATLRTELEAPMTPLEVQRDLNFLGATPALAEDGIMGPKTTQAVKDFQTQGGLIPDGIVGPETSYAIRFALGEHVNSAAVNPIEGT